VKTKSKTKEDIKFIWDPYHEKESTLTTWYIRERTNDPKFFMVEKPLHSERGAGPKAGMALLT
jgi:glutathionylspermidine synthase